MQAGVIASVETTSPIKNYRQKVSVDDHPRFDSLEQCIEIRQEFSLEDGRTAQVGRAAIEDLRNRESTNITDGGEIVQREQEEKYTRYTEFLHVSGSFLMVRSSTGTFLFDLLNNHTDKQINVSNIRVNEFTDEHPQALVWKVGFRDRGNNAENGIIHGDGVMQDTEVGDILGTSDKNQVGLVYDFNSESIKMFITEGGYVEIYQPSNYDVKDTIRFVESELLHLMYQE
ncbi:hypothetical protein [Salinirussus salinus]|uniref:hypothetical protein n=1 Tax=Salinirussus salinus TaxID=1198300 RepID=UPI00135C3C15|nr:hypothetical protein [Salinirussus salinus]